MYLNTVINTHQFGERHFHGETIRAYNDLPAGSALYDLSNSNFHSAEFVGHDPFVSIDFSGCTFTLAQFFAEFVNCNFTDAVLTQTDLGCAQWTNCDFTRTCLDPNAPIDQYYNDFTRLNRLPDGRYIGWRTQRSRYMGENLYEAGKTYTAPYFSVDRFTDCHPGLYFYPSPDPLTEDQTFWGYGLIKVAVRKEDMLQVMNKWRCRQFEVLEVLQAAVE